MEIVAILLQKATENTPNWLAKCTMISKKTSRDYDGKAGGQRTTPVFHINGTNR